MKKKWLCLLARHFTFLSLDTDNIVNKAGVGRSTFCQLSVSFQFQNVPFFNPFTKPVIR